MAEKKTILLTHLAKRYKRNNGETLRVLEAAGVQPVMSAPFGRGQMRWYDPKAAKTALDAAWVTPKASPPTLVAPGSTLSGIEAKLVEQAGRIDNLMSDISSLADVIDALRTDLRQTNEQCTSQNRVVFQTVEKLSERLSTVLDQLGVKP